MRIQDLEPPWNSLSRLCVAALFVLVAGLSLSTQGCRQKKEFLIQGTTMGTGYLVRLVDASAGARSGLEADIVRRLEEINAHLSVFRTNSEISRFNAVVQTGRPVAVSGDFQNVIRASVHVHELTHGAFDPTVKPLLDLWGFGPGPQPSQKWQPPGPETLQKVLESVGLKRIDASNPGQLQKKDPCVQLDFGAVAKGYAVDQIADILRRQGLRDFLVDIGGDLLASGTNKDGEAWRVGLNRPAPDAAWEDVLLVLRPRDRAVVTSGDYRKFFVHEGRFYSHVLDPRSGRPAQNNVASVTVAARTAMFADALATGLMVLGAKAGLELVETLPGVEALFLLRGAAGDHETRMSTGFAAAAGMEAS